MRSIRVGSVFGFEIRLDYSWFIIFFLILWSFGGAVFPLQAPGHPPVVYLAMGVAATILFFASLIAHELSHSLAARGRGMPMEGITLFIFGGMARIRSEPERPGDEFFIAVVGPLSSLAIAGAFATIGWAGMRMGWSETIAVVAFQLALLNIALAVFNLLPGLPLDGGRLLRAAVWKRTGDRIRATRIAADGGKWIAMLLIVIGVWQILSLNVIGGLWLILIGTFLRATAESSYLQLLLRNTLAGVTAANLMTPDPATVPADVTVEEFVDQFLFQGRHLGYPVVRDGPAVGLVTLHQVKKVPRDEWSARTVGEVMEPLSDRIIVQPDDGVDRVLEKVPESPTGRLLVMDGDRAAGIITRSDIARWMERARLLEGG